MEKVNRFPIGFFEKVRPKVAPSTNPDDKIIPFVFPNNVEVLNGKYKNKSIITLLKGKKK